MRLAIIAHDASAVDGENDRQILDADIVNELIIGPLQEGRVDCYNRNKPLGGQPSGERDSVLLANANVEDPVGEFTAGL